MDIKGMMPRSAGCSQDRNRRKMGKLAPGRWFVPIVLVGGEDMHTMRLIAFGVAVLALAGAASAQAPVTVTDLTRLDAMTSEVRQQLVALKKSDATLAAD